MNYHEMLLEKLKEMYAIASKAREKGIDPSDRVETVIARDLAERVEGLLGIEGIKEKIYEMESQGMERELVAFEMAKAIARGNLLKGSRQELADKAIRVGVAILTEGVLVAPTEGISEVKINKDKAGREFLSVYYAGPIRSAGGTVAALSVMIADVVRREMGIPKWNPSPKVIARYVEEVNIYDRVIARLQYKPPDEHVEWIVKHLPVEVSGDPDKDVEVSVNRNLEEIEGNGVRKGPPLVLCEGIAQKASKLLKYAEKLGILEDWEFLKELVKEKVVEEKGKPEPNPKFLEGTVAGRPILSYPSAIGGFRLRYGKSPNNGLMAKAIHPATMVVLGGFIAHGTQIRIERPGKSAVISAVESIEGPIVKLKDGSVKKLSSFEEAKKLENDIVEVLFLGDILVDYGDFSKVNSPLLPSPYVEEWWELDAKEKGITKHPESFEEAYQMSKDYGIPLHPKYLFYWDTISLKDLENLISLLSKGRFLESGEFVVPLDKGKRSLELLGVEHRVSGNDLIIEGDVAKALIKTLGGTYPEVSIPPLTEEERKKDILTLLSHRSNVKIMPKGSTFIGARMGRPEKAAPREMRGGRINVLFPTGIKGQRSFSKIYESGKGRYENQYLEVEIANLYCPKCKMFKLYRKCDVCNSETILLKRCRKCSSWTQEDVHCGFPTSPTSTRKIEFLPYFRELKRLFPTANEIRGVEGLVSKLKIPERLEKGFLRAKYSLTVFKDGTVRFDAIDMPLTHFRPKDINVSVEKLKSLGYERDYLGNPLEREDQIVPLKVQDIIIPKKALDYLFRVTKFVDEELKELYGMDPYYNLERPEDLIGHLVLGQSPHTSASILGRIIGYTHANVVYAHPFFHAAKRRNCDGDEDSIMLPLDVFLNFSRYYLGESRGGTMDAPIILVPRIDPKEIDDEAHEIEVTPHYPKEFYEATHRFAYPSEVELETVKKRLSEFREDPEKQIPFTHSSFFLDKGVLRTTYVRLKSIPEKIDAEIKVMEKIRAIDLKSALEQLINEHFIPDIYGNLRKFARQEFRCVKCNTKYRRPPLKGVCVKCGNKLTLTIHYGGIIKYLEYSLNLAEKFDLSVYLKQRLNLVKEEIMSMFEDEKDRQYSLYEFLN